MEREGNERERESERITANHSEQRKSKRNMDRVDPLDPSLRRTGHDGLVPNIDELAFVLGWTPSDHNSPIDSDGDATVAIDAATRLRRNISGNGLRDGRHGTAFVSESGPEHLKG